MINTPAPLMGMYDGPMWNSIGARGMKLQCCRNCSKFQYPPSPVCDRCLSADLEWKTLSGTGDVISWVIYHKQYLDAYPAPYNVIAVRLAEGPVMVSNLKGGQPEGNWIGQKVRMVYTAMADGFVLPQFEMDIAAST